MIPLGIQQSENHTERKKKRTEACNHMPVVQEILGFGEPCKSSVVLGSFIDATILVNVMWSIRQDGS